VSENGILFVASYGTVNTAASTSYTRSTLGTGSGFRFLCLVADSTTVTVTSITAGWNLYYSATLGNMKLFIYWQYNVGAASNTILVNFSASVLSTASVVNYTGVHPTNPFMSTPVGVGNASSVASLSFPAMPMLHAGGTNVWCCLQRLTTGANSTGFAYPQTYALSTGSLTSSGTSAIVGRILATVSASNIGQRSGINPSEDLTIDNNTPRSGRWAGVGLTLRPARSNNFLPIAA
jgi:hypothetical protein